MTSTPERVVVSHLYSGELHEDFTTGSVVVAELTYSFSYRLGRHFRVRLTDLTKGTVPYTSEAFTHPLFAANDYCRITGYHPSVRDFEGAAV